MVFRFALVAAMVGLVAVPASADPSDNGAVRVGLFYGPTAVQSVRISGVGKGGGESAAVRFWGEVTAAARDGQIVVQRADDGEDTEVGRWIEFAPAGRDPWLELGDATYRGKIRLDVVRGDRLRVVNIVDIEDYVRGVVPNEMFADLEAYKVQAVISRTYLVYVRDAEHKHQADGFDICTTGHCQVYRGVDSEEPLSDEAVAATKGQLLTYQGRPIFSAYHSNAGGVTRPVDEAWPGSIRRNFPYLCQVDSPYDGEAGSATGLGWCYRWQRDITSAELASRLRARGKAVGEVRELTPLSVTSSGAITEMEVVGADGRVRLKTPTEIRELLGVPSDRLTIEKRASGFRLLGWGNGHGVGLSQHGAFAMSKAGYRYEQILGQYYRSVDLTDDYGRGASRPLSPPEVRITAAQPEPAPVPGGTG
ncbi:MAG: SpoIID/LytB domain-containing protein [Armatimonadota bacterium]